MQQRFDRPAFDGTFAPHSLKQAAQPEIVKRGGITIDGMLRQWLVDPVCDMLGRHAVLAQVRSGQAVERLRGGIPVAPVREAGIWVDQIAFDAAVRAAPGYLDGVAVRLCKLDAV